MTESKIEWTDRSDWNPVRGCTRVSPGCGGPGPHGGCYAEALAARFSQPGMWGHGFAEMKDGKPRWTGKVELQEDRVSLPLRWKEPARIFVNSTSDIFHEALPDATIDKIFAVMALCHHHTFQVLTKRAERMHQYMMNVEREAYWMNAVANLFAHAPMDRCYSILGQRDPWLPLKNVWLGVSAERQPEYDERASYLVRTPAAVRYISAEPLLGPIDLLAKPRAEDALGFLDWVIVGGESGRNARPMSIQWARELRDQCKDTHVEFFFKQWGEWAPAGSQPSETPGHFAFGDYAGDRETMIQTDHYPRNFTKFGARSVVERVGKKAAGRLLDGIEHNGMPGATA
jgi:protein gp37